MKQKVNKFICIILLVAFVCFSSFQLHKVYTKAVGPLAIPLAWGTELIFNLVGSALITYSVGKMGSEAKKVYEDWQNNKNDDEKKSQYTHWGNELKNSMPSDEVQNFLQQATNVINGKVGLTLSSRTYQEFITNVNADREKMLETTFKSSNEYLKYWDILESHAKNNCCGANIIYDKFKDNIYYPYRVISFTSSLTNWGLNGNQGLILWGSKTPITLKSANNFITQSSFHVIAFGVYNGQHWSASGDSWDNGNKDISQNIVKTNFDNGDIIQGKTEIEVTQPSLEIQANPDLDSNISVSVPVTEADKGQLIKSPYKENASNFEYPDNFEETVNNTQINNEYNKNPIQENNDGLLDTGETVNIDFRPLYQDLSKKFPFCIPWDFKNQVLSLKADEVVPSWEVNFDESVFTGGGSFTVDFSKFNEFRLVFRYSILVIFVVGLFYGTRKLMGGSGE